MKIQFPHPFILLVGFIFLAAILTNILPAGEYDRILDPETDRNIAVAGSYKQVEPSPIGFFEAFIEIPKGIIDRADVIVLILIIGGAFYVVEKTGAFNQAIYFLINRFKNSRYLVLIMVGIAFAIGGATINMQEEIIALIPLMMSLCKKLNFKKHTAIAISFGSAVIASACSPINPFQSMIAQALANVELFSASGFRFIFMLIMLAFWYYWVIKTGKESIKTEIYEELKVEPLTQRSILILSLLVGSFIFMSVGVVKYDWGYNEMSALFLGFGFLAGFIGKMGINGTSKVYAEGFKEMAFAAIVVGLASGISLTLQDGRIIDTIVYNLFQPLKDLPRELTVIGAMITQTLIHIPVSSVSGQAALTMPLVSPLADLLDISRQVMILAYQYGAGLADLMVPTNGALMAMLLTAGISYKDWLKYTIKPLLIMFMISSAALLCALFFNIN